MTAVKAECLSAFWLCLCDRRPHRYLSPSPSLILVFFSTQSAALRAPLFSCCMSSSFYLPFAVCACAFGCVSSRSRSRLRLCAATWMTASFVPFPFLHLLVVPSPLRWLYFPFGRSCFAVWGSGGRGWRWWFGPLLSLRLLTSDRSLSSLLRTQWLLPPPPPIQGGRKGIP